METMAEQAAEIASITSDLSEPLTNNTKIGSPVGHHSKSNWPPPKSAFQSLPLVQPKRTKVKGRNGNSHHLKNPTSPASAVVFDDSLSNLFQGALSEDTRRQKIEPETGLSRHSHRSSHVVGHSSRRGSMNTVATTKSRKSASRHQSSDEDEVQSFAISEGEVVSSLDTPSRNGNAVRSGYTARRRSSSGGSTSSSSISLWSGADVSRDFQIPGSSTKLPLNGSVSFEQQRASLDSPVHPDDDEKGNNHEGANKVLFDNLDRHWSETDISYNGNRSITAKYCHQACLASFVWVFAHGDRTGNDQEAAHTSEAQAPPASVVVRGLWARVVLPALLKGSSRGEEAETPDTTALETTDLVAQQAWTSLTSEMGFLYERDDKTVSIVHSAFLEYGRKLASTYPDVLGWKSSFAVWMQDTFLSSPVDLTDDDHKENLRYAAKALLPTLLECEMYSEVTSLLRGSSSDYVVRLWDALHDEENAIKLTERYVVGNVERYLNILHHQRSSAEAEDEEDSLVPVPCSPQEVLQMYEAWYSVLQREMEDLGLPSFCVDILSGLSSDVCSVNSSGISEDDRSAASSRTSLTEGSGQQRLSDRKQRRERQRQRRKQLHESRRRKKRDDLLRSPLLLLVHGRALHILAESFMESIFAMAGDPELTVSLWRRESEYLAQAMQILSIVVVGQSEADSGDNDVERDGTEDEEAVARLNLFRRVGTLLCADSWVSQSECLGAMQDNQCPVDESQLLTLSEMFAPRIKTQVHVNVSDPRLNCLNVALKLLENPVEFGPPTKKLQPKLSNRLNLFRETLRGDINDAIGRLYFDRKMYDLARGPCDDAVRRKRVVLTLLREVEDPNAGESGIFSFLAATRETVTEERPSLAEAIVEELCLYRLRESPEKEMEHAELSLSQSLEYAALVMHERGFSMPALSLLQESLLLKTCHLGKTNMEVARLNAAMAAIHDDVMQWEAALPRRRECLRIRMQFLSQYDPSEWILYHEGVFQSVLEILRAMGDSHRMLDACDDAIGCYWKIAALARRQWEVLRGDQDEPTHFYGFSALDHERRLGEDLRSLCSPTLTLDEERHVPAQILGTRYPTDDEPETKEVSVLREIAQSYQTIISLFKDKEFASRPIQPPPGNRHLADVIAEQDVPLLLTASYQLGVIHMYYGDYRSAMHTFDHSLHSMWIMDPGSSDSSGAESHSDEESHKRASSRKRMQQRRRLRSLGMMEKNEDEIYEEGLYHAVGLCRMGSGEHEQAIRYLMTALRYARRFQGPHSPLVAMILYEVAACYAHVGEHEKALEFWIACSKIHLVQDRDVKCEDNCEKTNALLRHANPVAYAKVLYCIGATLCDMGRFRNHMTLLCFEEAFGVFEEELAGSAPELANCLFFMSLTIFHRAGSDLQLLGQAQDRLKEATRMFQDLRCVPQADGKNGNEAVQGELQAHLFFLQGSILEAMGKSDLALGSLQMAHTLYVAESPVWNLHKASVLYAIGIIYKARGDNIEALRCFEDAMEIRLSRLGPGHEVVGTALLQLGEMFARRGDSQIALEMYSEARRILVSTGGHDSPLVAEVLLQMGSFQAKEGQLGDALQNLKGALVIRKRRTGMVFQAGRGVSDFAPVSLRNSHGSEILRKEMMDQDDALRKRFDEELARERQELAVVQHCIGNVYSVLHDFDNAIIFYKEAVETWRSYESLSLSRTADAPVSLADTLHGLGCAHSARKEYEKSLACLAESLKLKRAVDSQVWENPNFGAAEVVSVVLYNGNPKEDPTNLQHGNSLSYANTLHRIGLVYSRMNNRDSAVSCFDSALSIQRRLLDSTSNPIAQTLADMGHTLYGAKHRREEALQYYKAALEIRQSQECDSGSGQVGELLYRIGSLHDRDQQRATAMLYYRQAIQVYGRRYVHSAAKSLCRAMLLPSKSRTSADVDTQQESVDLFHTDGAGARDTLEDRELTQREHFRKVCSAMRKASQGALAPHMDTTAPSSWISLELYLYNLVDLLQLVGGEWREQVRHSLQTGLRGIQPDTVALPLRPQDAVVFQMLYLIQD